MEKANAAKIREIRDNDAPILATSTSSSTLQHVSDENYQNVATAIPFDYSSSHGTANGEGKLYESSTNSSLDGFQNPFLGGPKGSSLDPASENFSARAWILNLAGLTSKDPQRYPLRTAGISFKNLNVYGFGSPTDYQKTVGNVPLEIGAIFRWMMGTGKHQIQILKDFDGLVRPGEMLLVLGRPGSGCSTLLKTMSCDSHGLVVDSNSKINYQGISAKRM